jgi:hypothetical protein
MQSYRVVLTSFSATYTERWDADSPQEAEQKARQRWQREFGDAGGFRFHAVRDTGRCQSNDDDTDD